MVHYIFQNCVTHNNQYLFDVLSDVTKVYIQFMSYCMYLYHVRGHIFPCNHSCHAYRYFELLTYIKLNYSISYIHKFKMSAQKATNPKQGKKRKENKTKRNFNSEECNVLVDIVEQNLDTLRGQFSSTITNAKKQKLWQTVYFPD